MNKRFLKAGLLATGLTAALLSTAASCDSDADTASRNISTEADQFRVVRTIVVTNNINGEVLWRVNGRCSLDLGRPGILELTCKEAPGEYKKHYVGLSDNTSWASTQEQSSDVSVYNTTVVWKPTAIVPNIDISVDHK